MSDPDGLRPKTDEEWYGPTRAQIDAAAGTTPSGGGGNSGPPHKGIDETKRVKNSPSWTWLWRFRWTAAVALAYQTNSRTAVTRPSDGVIMASAHMPPPAGATPVR